MERFPCKKLLLALGLLYVGSSLAQPSLSPVKEAKRCQEQGALALTAVERFATATKKSKWVKPNRLDAIDAVSSEIRKPKYDILKRPDTSEGETSACLTRLSEAEGLLVSLYQLRTKSPVVKSTKKASSANPVADALDALDAVAAIRSYLGAAALLDDNEVFLSQRRTLNVLSSRITATPQKDISLSEWELWALETSIEMELVLLFDRLAKAAPVASAERAVR